MPKDGSKTKRRILNETTQLVLENGFAGTTIDQILERSEITKGSFFYHFSSKADLALALMDHFVKADMDELQASLEEIQPIAEPRERLLGFVQRFIDIFEELDTPYAGCLYASYLYEPEQFSPDIKDKVATALLKWREELVLLIEAAAKAHPPKIKLNADSLADLFTVTMEGAIITSKALNEAKLTARQLEHYKQYLALIFAD